MYDGIVKITTMKSISIKKMSINNSIFLVFIEGNQQVDITSKTPRSIFTSWYQTSTWLSSSRCSGLWKNSLGECYSRSKSKIRFLCFLKASFELMIKQKRNKKCSNEYQPLWAGIDPNILIMKKVRSKYQVFLLL